VPGQGVVDDGEHGGRILRRAVPGLGRRALRDRPGWMENAAWTRDQGGSG
jgi:hypothetical protein